MPYLVSSQELQNKTPKHLGQVARNWYLRSFALTRFEKPKFMIPFSFQGFLEMLQQEEYPGILTSSKNTQLVITKHVPSKSRCISNKPGGRESYLSSWDGGHPMGPNSSHPWQV